MIDGTAVNVDVGVGVGVGVGVSVGVGVGVVYRCRCRRRRSLDWSVYASLPLLGHSRFNFNAGFGIDDSFSSDVVQGSQ